MLKLIVAGTLGANAVVKQVGQQKAINFDVAVHKDYKNGKGEKIEKTDWVKAVIWKSAEKSTKVAEYLTKGKKVIIEGDPSADAYLSKDKEPKASLTLHVKNLEFIA